MKKLLGLFVGLFVIASGVVFAAGNPPTPSNGPGLVDGAWLNGLAGGQNESYVSGIKAAGTTQATCTPLPASIAIIEIDTVPASSGVCLPSALQGTEFTVFNSTGTTLLYYPAVANNPVTAAQDTINGGTSFSVTGVSGGAVSVFVSAKNGVWGAK
jgi:hypothetical protein